MSASRVSSFRPTQRAFAKRLAVLSLTGILVAGAFAPIDVEAKRMGGSRSVGRQTQMAPSQSSTSPSSASPQRAQQGQPAQQNAAAAAPAAGANAAAQPRNRWLGPLAGIAAGLGIGALLSHFGLGEGLAQFLSNALLIGLVVFAGLALFRFIARKRRPDLAYSHGRGNTNASQHRDVSPIGYASAHTQQSASNSGAQTVAMAGGALNSDASSTAVQGGSIPSGFDQEGFVRNAKVSFVRLQAAWDRGDQGDIYEFTTPEMFAEIKMDLEARGKLANRTDVVELDAKLLGVEERGNEQLASIRFNGLIRENEGESAQPFSEVWNFTGNTNPKTTWRLAGIQQIA